MKSCLLTPPSQFALYFAHSLMEGDSEDQYYILSEFEEELLNPQVIAHLTPVKDQIAETIENYDHRLYAKFCAHYTDSSKHEVVSEIMQLQELKSILSASLSKINSDSPFLTHVVTRLSQVQHQIDVYLSERK